MRPLPKINKLFALLLLTLITTPPVLAALPAKKEGKKSAQFLPSRFGEQVVATGKPQLPQAFTNEQERANLLVTDGARRTYRTAEGKLLVIEVVQARTTAAAFALLTVAAERVRRETNSEINVVDGIGAYNFTSGKRILFFRGTNFVSVEAITDDQEATGYSYVAQVAKEFDSLLIREGASDEGIPVLVMHLPAWEQAQRQATYAVSLAGLQEVVGEQPILHGYDFSGGTEAVIAPYPSETGSPARLVIIEHFTPQLAADNERFISNRASELRASGASVPAYRRVGNYLVFVFGTPTGAPTDTAANELIGRVKYEQDVRWLGDYPFAQERAQRAYTMMSLGVLLASLKSAGIGILLCLGIGSIVGSLIFMRRRAQSLATATYTDAGGMVRLGIDNLTREDKLAPLLSSSEKPND